MKWVSTFSYLPINYGGRLARVENQTQRIAFDNNLNGSRVRLRFSNRYGTTPLHLAHVTVGYAAGDGVDQVHTVTLRSSREIILDPGQELWSDEVALEVCAGQRLAVTSYVDGPQDVGSVCAFWSTVLGGNGGFSLLCIQFSG